MTPGTRAYRMNGQQAACTPPLGRPLQILQALVESRAVDLTQRVPFVSGLIPLIEDLAGGLSTFQDRLPGSDYTKHCDHDIKILQ